MSDWFFRYRIGDAELLASFPTPEAAIDAACLHIEGGGRVAALGSYELAEEMDDPEELHRLYELWSKERHPFGHRAISTPTASVPTKSH